MPSKLIWASTKLNNAHSDKIKANLRFKKMLQFKNLFETYYVLCYFYLLSFIHLYFYYTIYFSKKVNNLCKILKLFFEEKTVLINYWTEKQNFFSV